MAETQRSGDVSPGRQRIAELARERPDLRFTSLNHHLDLDALREAYFQLRKDAAAGIDGVTWHEYGKDLEANLRALLDRARSGRYRAPPVRRVRIPKEGKPGETRPLGIPTVEDKVLQRAVATLLEAVYEQDFLDCSYGFRPGRSPHQALEALWRPAMDFGGGWVVEGDIRKCFDTLDHGVLREFLGRRIGDGVLLRLVGKWLNAGVLEDGAVTHPAEGTPQGGAISPLLANVFLHHVLDDWFRREVQPRLAGRAALVRYADDFVIVFENEADAKRVLDVLPLRFGRFGLDLHPEKTRRVRFVRPSRDDGPDRGDEPGTFDFLGFTHRWARSKAGAWVVRRRTATGRPSRALVRVWAWCRAHRHDPVGEQRDALAAKLRGHYGYYGVTGNSRSLGRFWEGALRGWRRWLDRRGGPQARDVPGWRAFLARMALPRPKLAVVYGR